MNRSAFQFAHVISKKLPTPIYLQLVQAVVLARRDGHLENGQIMPSINSLSAHYRIARSTVEKGYSELREMGILESHHGRGFFVKEANIISGRRILFLFNELNNYQKSIFEAFSRVLANDVLLEMVVYDNDPRQFIQIVRAKMEGYSHYIVLPAFSKDGSEAFRIIDGMPKHKLILLESHKGQQFQAESAFFTRM